MYEAILKLKCSRPELIKQGIEPDIENDSDSETILNAHDDHIEIVIKSRKLNYLKAMINSYISAVNMLERVEKIE